jgi:thiamine biosynthesis protein ThiI
MLLLSGGIDSPVAGWMMSKRGLEIEAIHFFSYPYTGLKSKEKVIDLARILARFTHSVKLHIIPFTDIQLYINENCPEEYSVIIMRRIMIILANRLARKTGSKALITGECLGQVASQTIEALSVTDTVSELPVFRPLIGMDKLEIIQIAKDIESYETSILPYEDCCTVFVPKHPKTKPSLKSVLEIEEKMDVEEMIEKAIKEREKILI